MVSRPGNERRIARDSVPQVPLCIRHQSSGRVDHDELAPLSSTGIFTLLWYLAIHFLTQLIVG